MHNLHKQKGFLSIVAIIMVMIVGLIAVSATYQFISDVHTSTAELSSSQAFYTAMSGIERARHNILVNDVACTAINGATNYTNANFTGARGTFTVTGTATNDTSTLNGAVNASTTSIPLVSTSGFASSGAVLIDSELINYTGISGNTLINATRGVAGTTSTSHTSGEDVTQSQCLLTSTGGVPNLTSPTGKRILKEVLTGVGFSIGTSSTGTPLAPTIFSVAGIDLTGNSTITNPYVTVSSPEFSGSTISTAGTVDFNGAAGTKISNGAGGLVTSSNKSHIGNDVRQNEPNVNAGNLFGKLFKQPKNVVQSRANQSYTSTSLDGVTGQTIWITGNVQIKNETVGSLTSPVLLIVNGNVDFAANGIFYGFLYATGTITMGANTLITGAVASESSFDMSGGGGADLVYNRNVLTQLLMMNNDLSTRYHDTPASLQESFS